MEDVKNNLLIKMTLKIYEARTYSTIKLFLFILWFIDFLLVIFRYLTFDIYYWLVFIIFLVRPYTLLSFDELFHSNYISELSSKFHLAMDYLSL